MLSSTLPIFTFKAKPRKTLLIPIFLLILLFALCLEFKFKAHLDFLFKFFMRLLLFAFGFEFGFAFLFLTPCSIDSCKLRIRQLDFSCRNSLIFPSTYNVAHVNISFLFCMLQKLFIYGVRNTTSR